MNVIQYSESWIPPENLGSSIPPYQPTYQGKPFINENHRFFSHCPLIDSALIDIGIRGWLRREDALKLYELAYFASGDILEFGCYHGLSTSILARAVKDSYSKKLVVSIDFEPTNVVEAERHILARGLKQHVRLECRDALTFCHELTRDNKRFGFVFIDHSHAYNDVLPICRLLPTLVLDGAFCLFHDFNDIRNADPQDPEYGVARAVYDGLSPEHFEFYGIFGCAALFRKIRRSQIKTCMTDQSSQEFSKSTVESVSAGGERVTHLYPNNSYYAHLSLYHFAAQFSQDKVVLDAGSGAGYGSDYLADHGARHVLGIDVSVEAVAFSRKFFPKDNLEFQVMDLEHIEGLPSQSFDLVFTSNVLEHLKNVPAFLRAAWDLLKPQGILVAAVPPIVNEDERAQNYINQYHFNIWSPAQWGHVLNLFFCDIQCYRHGFDKPGVPLDLGNSPEQTVIDEKDFVFEPISLHDYPGALSLTAIFVARKPRQADEIPQSADPITFVDNSCTVVEKDPLTLAMAIEVATQAATIRRLTAQLEERDGRLQTLLAQAPEQKRIQSQLRELHAAVHAKNEHIIFLEGLIRRIENGRLMRILRVLDRARRQFF